MRRIPLLMLLFVVLAPACSEDDGSPVKSNGANTMLLGSGFDGGLDGWSDGTHASLFGTVTWLDREGGVVKLDGVGFDGNPNAWISKQLALPADAKTLRTSTSAHDRNDGEVALRVRIVDDGQTSHTIQDWTGLKTEDQGFEFFPQTFDISAYAGQTVTVYFEIGDMDGGGNNQRYIDYIEVHK